jgi:hypothetical protein
MYGVGRCALVFCVLLVSVVLLVLCWLLRFIVAVVWCMACFVVENVAVSR